MLIARFGVFRILQLAGPIAFQDVLLMLQDVISFAFVGHIDKTSLSCMTLAGTMFNLSGLSLVMGLASGAETLSGQVSLHRVLSHAQAGTAAMRTACKQFALSSSRLAMHTSQIEHHCHPFPQSPRSNCTMVSAAEYGERLQCFGAKNYKALGVTLQKSLLITWLLCIMVVAAWTQLGHLLLATGE